MGEYLLGPEDLILRNLLKYPPVEGSMASHEAWKENVRFLLHRSHKAIWIGLVKPGFISTSFRNECISFGEALPSERKV